MINQPHPPLPLAPPNPDLPVLARHIDTIFRNLLALIRYRSPLLGSWATPIHNRIASANRRLILLLTRIAAGTYRPAPKRPRPPGRPACMPPVRIPTRQNYIGITLGYHARGFASQLQHFLDQPETIAALAQAPSAIRTLRPICRILGVTIPPALDPSPPQPAPRKPRPRAPRPPPIPPRIWGPLPGGIPYRPSITHSGPRRRKKIS